MINCTFENGNKANLRHVTVGALVLNSNNEILLVKRAAGIVGANKFTIPGGFLDRKENTAEGALRELKEETGYSGKAEALFQVNDNPHRPKEDRQNVDFIYLIRLGSKEANETPETQSIGWFSKDNLPIEDEFAFDHRNIVLRYFEYLKKPFQLPIIGPV